MQTAPRIIDGADVIAYTPIDHRHRPTGGCRQIVAGVLQGPAAGLAICQYRGQQSFYHFGCDENWRTKTDTFHQTLEEAMDQAEFQYLGVRKTWLNHEPAWEELSYEEMKTIWDLFDEQFNFKPSTKPSDWHGIAEPAPSVTCDISHLFDGSESARAADLISLNVEVLDLFRQCVLPGQRLYALDWQHPCYWFNPFGQYEFTLKLNNNGMVPIIPNGDYYIFLADDFRFGTFGHPWQKTICVFGEQLLDVVMQEQPSLFQHIIRFDGQVVR